MGIWACVVEHISKFELMLTHGLVENDADVPGLYGAVPRLFMGSTSAVLRGTLIEIDVFDQYNARAYR